jgi:pyrrolidone-carboxylate peptidase
MKLLVTAFEPFGSSAVNASEQVLHLLDGRELPGVQLFTALLPVEQEAGPRVLIERLEQV